MTGREQRWRDALLAAILPAPGDGLPAFEELELDAFWARFEATAPVHLRLGLRAAAVGLACVLPRLLGHARALPELDPDARDAVLRRGLALPVFADLLQVAKMVVCLAYFADPTVEALVRGNTVRGRRA